MTFLKHNMSLWLKGLGVIVLLAFSSCRTITSFVHGLGSGPLVAKVGTHRLYASDLASYIPDGVSSEDSAKLAMQYINSWASAKMFADLAEKELTKSEKNVDRELEEYRQSLLKYRYEQKYINQRLDTAVTWAQIEKYYEDHKDIFRLQVPVAKAVFMSISAESPNLEIIKKKMKSDDPKVRIEADSIAFTSAYRYTDFNDSWVDLVRLSKEFATDYATVLSNVRNGFVEIPDDNGVLNVAYISQMINAGKTGPVEFYSERIKDIILSTRKQALLNGLERDLLDNSRSNNGFVIY